MYKKYIKRFLDLFVSLILGVILIPIFAIIAIIMKIFDKGPIFFLQERTGLNGKVFSIYKFRTMKVATHDKEGRKLNHKERITKLGVLLRKTSIDELPQIINVIKGEMSFIGPRPWMLNYYENFTDRQRARVSVPPGITGLAQAKGRNGIGILKKIEYDIEYANAISFRRDFKILLMTIYIVLNRQHAEIVQEDMDDEINVLRTIKTKDILDDSTEFGVI